MGGREHPILFGDDLVRAILAGTKTQTRRPLRPQPNEDKLRVVEPIIGPWQGTGYKCPFGTTGDRLWVRECWAPLDAYRGTDPGTAALAAGAFYRTDYPVGLFNDDGSAVRWRPSIHMPRWASRIVLDVVQVRVERVQDITEADAICEGLPLGDYQRPVFAETWDRIYPGSWERNDWVWCVEFRRAA